MKVKEDLVLVLTIESVVIGVVLGFMIRPFNPSNDAISLIGFPGEIFMQIVEMMILPLIISSVISALAQIRPNDAGRIGGLTVLYYVMTTFLSTFTGIILVSSIHPGDPMLRHALREGTLDDTALSTLDTFLDQIRNMFPENIVQATFQQVQTNYVPVKQRIVVRHPTNSTSFNASNVSTNLMSSNMSTANSTTILKPTLIYTNEVNVLGLIVFCTGFGVILSILGEQARLMINFFIVLDAVIMKWISALMWCYPIGILSLVCKNIVDIDNLTETAQALAMYVVTVICGLMIHSLLTLPLLYYLFTRNSPFDFMTGMLQAVATAFGTASSGASLPVTFRALEGNLKIDRRVTRFVLPLGATITMDGTALYEAVAVIFIAQLHNIQLSVLELLTISLTTTVASIGSGSVPAGLDTILIVLATVGLPAKDLSLLLTVDWLLDRIRTSVNVLGDGFGCGIIYHLTKKRLIESDNDELIQQLRKDIKILNADLPNNPTQHLSNLNDDNFYYYQQNKQLLLPQFNGDELVNVQSSNESHPTQIVNSQTLHSQPKHGVAPYSYWLQIPATSATVGTASVGQLNSEKVPTRVAVPSDQFCTSNLSDAVNNSIPYIYQPTTVRDDNSHLNGRSGPSTSYLMPPQSSIEIVSTSSISPCRASMASSRVSVGQSVADERRSLLDGSLEFTL